MCFEKEMKHVFPYVLPFNFLVNKRFKVLRVKTHCIHVFNKESQCKAIIQQINCNTEITIRERRTCC